MSWITESWRLKLLAVGLSVLMLGAVAFVLVPYRASGESCRAAALEVQHRRAAMRADRPQAGNANVCRPLALDRLTAAAIVAGLAVLGTGAGTLILRGA